MFSERYKLYSQEVRRVSDLICDYFELSKKVVVITNGGTGGLQLIATTLAAEGKTVHIPELEYFDAHNIMCGIYTDSLESADYVYMSYPNNPTGELGTPNPSRNYIFDFALPCESFEENIRTMLSSTQVIGVVSFSKMYSAIEERIGFVVLPESFKSRVHEFTHAPSQSGLRVIEDILKGKREVYQNNTSNTIDQLRSLLLPYGATLTQSKSVFALVQFMDANACMDIRMRWEASGALLKYGNKYHIPSHCIRIDLTEKDKLLSALL